MDSSPGERVRPYTSGNILGGNQLPSWIVVLGSVLLLGAQGHDDPTRSLLLALVILLPSAKFAGLAAEKVGQPAILGELIAGMILGNLGLIGFHGCEYLKTDAGLEILANLG